MMWQQIFYTVNIHYTLRIELLAERPTQDGEVLAEDEDLPPVDGPPAGDDSVSQGFVFVQTEVDASVCHILVDLHKGPRIQEPADPLPGCPLSLGPLLGDGLLPAAGESGYAFLIELLTKLLDSSESHIRHVPP